MSETPKTRARRTRAAKPQPAVEPQPEAVEPAEPEVDQEAVERAEETEAKGKLQAAIDGMTDTIRRAFVRHLEGETSAEYLSDWLERYGTPVSASSIRAYRRAQSRREGM
ncbi:hypothetical protein [Micromonospora sp. NPDC049240]|uniref:hypothetical protein n=1 Tax=Micromonospora sp. NPDC049240 TaxID=3155151 RepID=UPI00340DDBA6